MKRVQFFLALQMVALLLVGGLVGQAQPGSAKPVGFGSGSAPVLAAPDVIDVAWDPHPANYALVAGATVTLASALSGSGLVCVQVTDAASTILANGCATGSGPSVAVPFDGTPSLTASAAAITGVSITATDPGVALDGPSEIEVTGVARALNTADTTLVEKVAVTFGALSTGSLNVKVSLTLKDAAGVVLQRKVKIPHTLTTSETTLTWALSPYVPAASIALFEIQVTPN